MKNFIKSIAGIIIFTYALYIYSIWTSYKEQEEIYYSDLKSNLYSICKGIMKKTYRQYLGPVGYENEHEGSVKLKATVYFPNIAPQNIYCSIYLDNFLIGYDGNTTVYIHFTGADYAPKGFFSKDYSYKTFIKTTFNEMQNYVGRQISPRKKPTFDSIMEGKYQD